MAISDKGEWKPNKKQEPFVALPTSIREAAYLGGAGSGKSDILLLYGILRGWHTNSRFKQVFMRRTFPELRNEIVPRSRDYYRPLGATFNRTEMAWTFPSGAMIFLGHCDSEDDVHKYDSMEINLFTPDEITSFTEFMYLYVGFTRVRTSDPSLPAIVRTAGMPGGIGHTWVQKRFIDVYPDGKPDNQTIIIGRGGNKRITIFATQADNPHIDPTYKQSLLALPEAEKRAKLYGDFSAYQGQVFDEFRDRKYPDEPDNALHVIEPFEIPEWWPRIVVIDWGYAAMTYIGFGAISPTKRLYFYRELHFQKTKIKEWAAIAKDYLLKENPRAIKLCKSAKQDTGTEHTVLQQVEEALGDEFSVELVSASPGSRIATKSLLHEYLRWKPKHVPEKDKLVYDEGYSQWLLRNKGVQAWHAYGRLFIPEPEEDNLPKLQIFKNNPLLINALKACTYEKSKDGIPAEDVAQFNGDDPYDDIRYMVDEADKFFYDAQEEAQKLKNKEEMIKTLARTNNWTSFYRNAERLDKEEVIGPIRRFH